MSAFVVDDRTINRVLAFINSDCERNPHIYKPLEEIRLAWDGKDAREAIGSMMFDLNIQGVEARYGKSKSKKLKAHNYKYAIESGTSRIQAFKSLQCWLYQCTEGDIPEASDLFQAFNDVLNKLARHIVNRLPEYNVADWG